MSSGSRKSVEALEAEAAAWAARLDADDSRLPPGLDEWLDERPDHAGALLRAQALLAAFAAQPAEDVAPAMARQGSGWRWPVLAVGSLAAMAAAIALLFVTRPASETFATQIGEVRSMTLSDGSSVAIDTQSRIDVAYSTAHRDVHLRAGRVLFRATHDGNRPFRVIVDDIIITDIGTAFQVIDDDAHAAVDVLVTEGAVAIDSPAGRVMLVAGQRRRFGRAAGPTPPSPPAPLTTGEMARSLAWREGRVEFDGETLETAIAQFNRYSRVPIIIGDPALRRERLHGAFRIDDTTGFAHAAAASLGVQARIDRDAIIIGARTP